MSMTPFFFAMYSGVENSIFDYKQILASDFSYY